MILPSPSDLNPVSGIPLDFKDPKKSPSSDYAPSSPVVSPPRYRGLRPAAPITYTFTPLPSNSMLLAPPPKINDSQRPYHISVSLNCFTPSSYITVIRKNSWDGELVGDFEMGAANARNPGTLCLRGNEYPISDILESQFNVFRTTWLWKVKSFGPEKPMSLFWDDYQGGGVLSCYSSQDRNSANLLAKFTPRSHLRRQGQPVEPPKLLVSPAGHDFFDDILLSALVIERTRTAPSS
ncbi:hypothetical protein B0H17DRAFT_1035240 [Mycena rosella]|uniref:DUF6593 domain-containing protein n=1 Tax=Mycena rosella TaxID=1033263 RepID=A0AAD7M8Y1_MYCRO|nr:hypothetical protein B0H17DRAFT_1035240 [Mycena rosella]